MSNKYTVRYLGLPKYRAIVSVDGPENVTMRLHFRFGPDGVLADLHKEVEGLDPSFGGKQIIQITDTPSFAEGIMKVMNVLVDHGVSDKAIDDAINALMSLLQDKGMAFIVIKDSKEKVGEQLFDLTEYLNTHQDSSDVSLGSVIDHTSQRKPIRRL